jgi:hypothetical protein
MLSLIEKLKQVKDFRKDKGKRHPLLVIILGTMLGYSGYTKSVFDSGINSPVMDCFSPPPASHFPIPSKQDLVL